MKLQERKYKCDTSREGNDCWISEVWIGDEDLKTVTQRTVVTGWCESDKAIAHTRPSDEMPQEVQDWFVEWGVIPPKEENLSPQLDALLSLLNPLGWRLVNGYPNGTVCPVYEAETVFGTYRASGAGRGFGGSPGRASYAIPGRGEIECTAISHGQKLCWADYVQRVAKLFRERGE